MSTLEVYSADLSRQPSPLSPPEESAADPDTLIRCNLRFAFHQAARYKGRGLPLEDLVSAANIGLIEAARTFDPAQGVRFVTWAAWSIRRNILRAIEEAGPVHLPSNCYKRGERILVESLDAPFASEDADNYRLDLVESSGPDTDAALEDRECVEFVAGALEGLKEREREALQLYFGLDGPEHTLEEIGARGVDAGLECSRRRFRLFSRVDGR